MSKYILLLILTFSLFSIFPQLVTAAPVISSIGDIDPFKAISVTVTGLSANQTYAWVVRKKTCSSFCIFNDPYTPVSTTCYLSTASGQITKDLGPFSVPGLFHLEIFKGNTTSGTCTTAGGLEVSQDFTVGSPVNPPGGLSCCSNPYFPYYNKDRNLCQISPYIPPLAEGIRPPGTTEYTAPTICDTQNPKTYCEPESLQCFKSQTKIVAGKICKDPKDGDFDKSKHVECGVAGGKQCGSPTDPAIQTAIGCIRTSPAGFAKDLLSFVIGISGGLAFLMMILGAFQMLTSGGNPETLAAGRSRLTSAVIGLLFIIFAILLLQIIGRGILNIPGFS